MRVFILISILMAAATVLGQAYRWVDDDGIVHYSDKPHEGAEQVVLPSDNRVVPRQQPAPAPRFTDDQQAAPPLVFEYDSITVATPAAEETLWNIEGVLNVSLDLQPALQTGHRVRVYFDGKQRLVSGTSFQLQEVYRGVHNLQAEVIDATGKLMIRSVPNRFYVQQTSIN